MKSAAHHLCSRNVPVCENGRARPGYMVEGGGNGVRDSPRRRRHEQPISVLVVSPPNSVWKLRLTSPQSDRGFSSCFLLFYSSFSFLSLFFCFVSFLFQSERTVLFSPLWPTTGILASIPLSSTMYHRAYTQSITPFSRRLSRWAAY